MVVFAVESGEYSDYGIDAVFSTRENAQAWIDAHSAKGPYAEEYRIAEWHVDQQATWQERTCYICTLGLKDGRIWAQTSYPQMAAPEARTPTPSARIADSIQLAHAQGLSYVSAEHAQKIATEARQEWLRTKDREVP